MGFTKLFSDILCSSVWNEDDKTRIVWITLLAMRGANNVARGSMDGLAHQARVSIGDCERAVKRLSSPDRYSGDPEFDGRRIEAVDHGWLILNGEKYRLRRDDQDRKEYMALYMREYRRKHSVNNRKHSLAAVSIVSPSESEQIREEDKKADAFSLEASASPTHTLKRVHARKPENRQQCVDHCMKNLGLTENDGNALWDHWQGNGFTVNGRAMKSWRHTASDWSRRGYFFPSLSKKESK